MSSSHEFLSVPHSASDVDALSRAHAVHFQAVANLGPYPGGVISRKSVGEPEKLPHATIYEEKIVFADGAVRTLTRVDPKASYFGTEGERPFLVSATDALGTGPDGFNKTVVASLASRGFAVAWLHHEGRHAQGPTSLPKAVRFAGHLLRNSLGRSAHQQHGMLDDIALNSDHATDTILSIGCSRAAMTGEAVDALAPLYNRTIRFSDYIAGCFEHRPTLREMPVMSTSLLHESVAISRLSLRLHKDGASTRELVAYLATFDLHPLNVINELSWVLPVLRGDAGRYADAVPLDQNGVRTFFNGDSWSSGGKAWQPKADIRPNLHHEIRRLPSGRKARHLDLIDPSIQAASHDRLERASEVSLADQPLDMRYIVRGLRSVK